MPHRKLTQNEFLNQCHFVHGSKYDYSQTFYKNSRNKITIICPKHGAFEIVASLHTSAKQGCKKCGYENRTPRQKIKQDVFISRCKIVHKNAYDYSETVYTGARNLVTVICPKHGKFAITAHNHSNHHGGCQKCQFSLGEKIVEELLMNLGLKYKSQVTFKDCKHKNLLRFDFQIFDNNGNFFLLEVDGDHHSRPVRFGGITEKESVTIYNFTVLRDKIKNKWAKDNNITLHRINYSKYKADIFTEKITKVIRFYLNKPVKISDTINTDV